MSDTEQLSRLLDGDLPADEAEALRQRIAAEPELARAWARMQALPGALADLPAPPVPPHLLPRAARPAGPTRTSIRRPPPPPSRLPWMAAAAAAAVALLVLGTRPAAPELVLESGSQVVSGEALLLAGPARVAVDGRARIVVEPIPGAVRAAGGKEDPMSARNAMLGAAAGALVTITVYEGRARLLADADTPTVEVSSGETRAIQVGAPAAATAAPAPLASRTETPAAAVARLESEAAALRTENEALRLEAAVAKGQLEAWQGKPVDFPADTPRALSPDGFGEHVRDALVGIPDTELLEVDCSEMPCMAVIRSTSPDEDWTAGLESLHGDGADWGTDQPVSVAGMASELDDDEDDVPPVRLFLVSAWPDDPEGPDVRGRLQTRSHDLLQGIGDDIMDDEAGE